MRTTTILYSGSAELLYYNDNFTLQSNRSIRINTILFCKFYSQLIKTLRHKYYRDCFRWLLMSTFFVFFILSIVHSKATHDNYGRYLEGRRIRRQSKYGRYRNTQPEWYYTIERYVCIYVSLSPTLSYYIHVNT